MDATNLPPLSVSDFLACASQVLEGAFPVLTVEGEVASMAVRQGKFVFFDLKDETGSVSCFMMVWQLRVALEDGMQVAVQAVPKLTARGKFSLTVQQVRPVGQGSIKKNFELLRQRLSAEGLFAPERKRPVPEWPEHIAVVSSPQAAGYADFMTIIGQRWGGMQIDVYAVPVQGAGAADRIIRAIERCNRQAAVPQVLAIVRGGGSADDLQVFNDEALVRAIAASRVPTVVGVGHDTDETLADLAADVRAVTPTNAAQLITPDAAAVQARLAEQLQMMKQTIITTVDDEQLAVQHLLAEARVRLARRQQVLEQQCAALQARLRLYNPTATLARGYALVRGQAAVGQAITIERYSDMITAEVTHVERKTTNETGEIHHTQHSGQAHHVE